MPAVRRPPGIEDLHSDARITTKLDIWFAVGPGLG
jgi:hypothetical protein